MCGVRVGVLSHVYVLLPHVFGRFLSQLCLARRFFFLASRMQGVGVHEKQKKIVA